MNLKLNAGSIAPQSMPSPLQDGIVTPVPTVGFPKKTSRSKDPVHCVQKAQGLWLFFLEDLRLPMMAKLLPHFGPAKLWILGE